MVTKDIGVIGSALLHQGTCCRQVFLAIPKHTPLKLRRSEKKGSHKLDGGLKLEQTFFVLWIFDALARLHGLVILARLAQRLGVIQGIRWFFGVYAGKLPVALGSCREILQLVVAVC